MKTVIIKDGLVFSLKAKDKRVNFIMSAGNDWVCNTMDIGVAMDMVAHGKAELSTEHEPYRICVDDRFYFEGTVKEDKSLPETPVTKE